MTFYMTWSRDQPLAVVDRIERHEVPIMSNAKNRYSTRTNRFNQMFEYDTERVIDSGGFNMQATYADQWGNLKVSQSEVSEQLQDDYPFFNWTVEKYHEWLAENTDKFKWAACMDYACEERFDPLWSIEDRIEATVENTIRHFDLHDGEYHLVPVLQGTTIDEYERCYNRLQRAGVPLEHVGIGSVCRRSSEKEIAQLEQRLRDTLAAVERMHGFGVKVAAFKHGAMFDSMDSFVWTRSPSMGGLQTLHDSKEHLILIHHKDELPTDVHWDQSFGHTFVAYYAHATNIVEGEPAIDMDEILEEKREMGIEDTMCDNKFG